MKAFSLCIDKKQKHFFFEKPNNQKQKNKQNIIFQLCQFSILFDENFMDWYLGYTLAQWNMDLK